MRAKVYKKHALHQAETTTPRVVLKPQILGYARVSTADQVMDVQMGALRKAGCDRIYSEKISAVNAKRDEFHLLLKHVERGDQIVVYAFSRLNRNLKDLLILIDNLKRDGITVRSTSEPHINPYTTHGRTMLQMVGTMDEMELNRVKDRTRDAMAEKKRQGMYLGRPRLIDQADIKAMKKMRAAGVSAAAIAKKHGIAVSTVYANT